MRLRLLFAGVLAAVGLPNVNPVVGVLTPLDLAIMAGKREAAELLKQNGGTRHAG